MSYFDMTSENRQKGETSGDMDLIRVRSSDFTTPTIFRDRDSAGFLLASTIVLKTIDDLVVVAIPNGGIPIAAQISRRFQIPVKVCMTTRITVPESTELSVGAISSCGDVYLDSYILDFLAVSGETISTSVKNYREKIAAVSNKLSQWRVDESLEGKSVLLVDDVIGTGTSIIGAMRHLQRFKPKFVIVAAPVISRYACEIFNKRKMDYWTVVAATESDFKPLKYYSNFGNICGKVCEDILSHSTFTRRNNERITNC